MVQIILEAIGVAPERVLMENCSSAEGAKIAQIARDMTAKLEKLGPSPLKISESE